MYIQIRNMNSPIKTALGCSEPSFPELVTEAWNEIINVRQCKKCSFHYIYFLTWRVFRAAFPRWVINFVCQTMNEAMLRVH